MGGSGHYKLEYTPIANGVGSGGGGGLSTEEENFLMPERAPLSHRIDMRSYDITIMCSDGSREIIPVHAKNNIAALMTALHSICRDWDREDLADVEGIRLPLRRRT